MSLVRRLQISLAVTACLGTLMMGLGQDNLLLPFLTAIVAFGALYVTDVKRWFVLNTTWANVAGLAALVLTLWNFASTGREMMFLALANLLVYLKCILFFREKVDRIYWMICILSLLEVVVAAVLNYTFLYGVLLVPFSFFALYTLTLFLVLRERNRCAGLKAPVAASGPMWEALAYHGPSALAGGRPAPPAPSFRWPLAGKSISVLPLGLKAEGPDQGVAGIRRQALKVSLLTVLCLPILFILVPRPTSGRGGWNSGGPAASITGFSTTVSLNALGPISQSEEEVMQLRFFSDDGEPYQLDDEPLLRGTSMSAYQNGEWNEGNMMQRRRNLVRPPRDAAAFADVVTQEITLKPMRTQHVFSVYPPCLAPGAAEDRFKFVASYGRLERSDPERSLEIQFELTTIGLRDGRHVSIVPQPNLDPNDEFLADPELRESNESRIFFSNLTENVGPRFHPRLIAAAAGVVEALDQERQGDPIEVARALETFLRDSGRFRYTLDRQPGDRRIDPNEDFIANSPEGSCFNFAAALTLMLRSREIPARIVNGYKGGEWNDLGKYYVVRQLHAHAWVEAWIPSARLPDELRRLPSYKYGGWLILDPTPAESRRYETSSWPQLREIKDYLQHLWGYYVMGMNENRQASDIYRAFVSLFQAETWSAMWRDAKALFSGEPRELESSGPALVIFVLGVVPLLCFMTFLGVRWLVRRWRARRGQSNSGARSGPVVDFYVRLERLLAALGIRRAPAQTQREFALAAGGVLADQPRGQVAASAPRRVAAAFYQVRFGNIALSAAQMDDVQAALTSLQDVVPTLSASSLSGH